MDSSRQTRLRSQTVEVFDVDSSKTLELLNISHDELVQDRELPVLRGENKRKRGIRGGNKHFLQDHTHRVHDYETETENRLELRLAEKTEQSRLDLSATLVSSLEEIARVDFVCSLESMKHLGDGRRESSRLRVKPSKFRESVPSKLSPPKEERQSDDVSSSLEILRPMDAKRAASLDNEINKPNLTGGRTIKGSQVVPRFGDSIGSGHESSSPKRNFGDNGLKAASTVVKRVMHIKSAEPFNEPVDPEALGIPDYLDVIKEPMDLGTIREALETGTKYFSAREVYEDVQLIWSNCRKYNQEGDPIMDIMRTAETVFNRYWNAAGLQEYKTSAENHWKNGQEEIFDKHSDNEDDMEEEEEDLRGVGSASKLKSLKVVHFNTPLSKLKGKSSGKDQMEFELHGVDEMKATSKHQELSTGSPSRSFQRRRESPPSNKRRTFGTAHHKPDCICVVCLGRRRKLAKLAIEQQRISEAGDEQLQNLKATFVRAQEYKSKKQQKAKRSDKVRKLLADHPTVKESESFSSDFFVEGVSEPEPSSAAPLLQVKNTKYYSADSEFPLRKVSEAVLEMSSYLFGSGERPWPGAGFQKYSGHQSAMKLRMLEAMESLSWNGTKSAS